ncbi:MAG: preprotein translocase subunit SecA, partial [Solirubrobacteraceae bacterium]
QALKAESLYKRDVDYAVVNGEVAIIDEFTGRILEGRRWAEGLHQATEAKEGVRVQEENQTLATITYQNYFRLYDKLSGMTGTAMTEATEFMKIYELGVVAVPTNRPMVRDDRNDLIFKTQEGKWNAVVEEVISAHEAGRPVLVGTISVEVSELLGRLLAKRGIKHTVLNAKPEYAEREGETVAEAGQIGAVTIATNMAGRGVDIKLGGSAEHQTELELKKQGLEPGTDEFAAKFIELLPGYEAKIIKDRETVMENGGLAIIGTERHESRRIDNQLRGRAGRQGDPGSSQFFLSGEDELVRLFAGDRIYNILERFGEVDEAGNEVPIQAGILSKQIEKAQHKVEEQNFLIRKRVLEYDDVMNEQRRVVYRLRNAILAGENVSDTTRKELRDVVARIVNEYTVGEFFDEWDVDGLFDRLLEIYPVALDPEEDFDGSPGREELSDRLSEDILEMYDEREEELGSELMRELERVLLLQIIDDAWREHLHDMDYLREGIHLRGFAQIEPIIAYKNEAFTLFQELVAAIWLQFAQLVFNVQVQVEEDLQPQQPQPQSRISGSPKKPAAVTYESGGGAGLSALAAAAAGIDPIAAAATAGQPDQGEKPEPMNREQRRALEREQKKAARRNLGL